MLRNTFQHIQGIGKKTEADIWASGVKCWDDLNKGVSLSMPSKTVSRIKQSISDSYKHLNEYRDPVYFYNLMPSKLHWRLFPDFMDYAVYLDIETTGLDYENGEITTIALYDGKNIRHYTNGYNLEDFLQKIAFRESVRCRICYHERLTTTAHIAKHGKFDAFSTTLLYSKFQNHELIKSVGEATGKKVGVKFYYHDFREGWKEGIEESKRRNMYRQQYCGCIYSEKERYFDS